MQTPIPKELSIALLISSIDVVEFAPVTAAVKTLSDKDATWDNVSARLLEEYQTLKSRNEGKERSHVVRKQCALCEKTGHVIEDCWQSPRIPRNRLGISPNEDKGKGFKPSEKENSAKDVTEKKPKRKV